MANVCHVPLSYIFLRGQGIKIFSLVSKKCRENNHVIPVLRKPWNPTPGKDNNNQPIIPKQLKVITENNDEENEEEEGYEGATVFNPEVGVHYEPITVLDFNALYPNSMRMKDLSHERLVKNKIYENLPDYYYNTAKYANKDGSITTCTFASPKNGEPGILGEILTELLNARSRMKDLAEEEKDPFKKKILDGLQLAYKLTSNSLYGQTGSDFSAIHCKEIAASTTSTGREMLNAARIFAEMIFPIIVNSIMNENYKSYEQKINMMFAKQLDELIGKENTDKLKEIIEGEIVQRYEYLNVFKNNRVNVQDENYFKFKDGDKKNPKYKNKTEFIKYFYDDVKKIMEGKSIKPNVIYGDTDSIFIKYNIRLNGQEETLKNQLALETSIKLGQLTSKLLFTILPIPQNMLYEKTFMPFAILSKKRYTGNKYATDPNKFYQDAMGLSLKRRDNAPIVKIVVGGIVKSILNDKDPEKAVAFTRETLKKILSNKYPTEKFIITKTLKGNALTESERKLEEMKPKEEKIYADRSKIAHAALADKIADRDPGNKPQSNERIPFAYIITDTKSKILQGDRVEHPDYIVENKLQLDYLFYITNQIMKPSLQFLEHITKEPDKIFESCIMKEMNRREGKRPITYYFNMLEEMKKKNDDVFGDNEDNEDEKEEEDNWDFGFEGIDESISDDEDNEKPKLKIGRIKRIKIENKNDSLKKKKARQVTHRKPVYDEEKGGFKINL